MDTFQLPKPGLKPLTSEEEHESQPSSSNNLSSIQKYKYSEKSTQKTQNANMSIDNLPKSNDAFSWDIYKNPSGYTSKSEKPKDLFSMLNNEVKVKTKTAIFQELNLFI